MLKKMCFILSFFIILSFSVLGQERSIREEYLKITPYVSTMEDVTRIYGEGDTIIKGRDDYLLIRYSINENKDVSIGYFRDCNQTDKPEKERTWIVRDVFFKFETDYLRIKPKDIFLNKKDFKRYLYGDVGGQIIYINKEKNIQFTYLSDIKAVWDLLIMPTEKNKERYKCRKNEVEFKLNLDDFRELETDIK